MPSKTSFGGLRKWDRSGLCPFPLSKMTGREQTGGGETYHRWGGSKTVFGDGFCPMLSPPLISHPPLFFSEFGNSQTWLIQTWLFAISTRKRSLALFCTLLRSFTDLCLHACALSAHLRVSVSDRRTRPESFLSFLKRRFPRGPCETSRLSPHCLATIVDWQLPSPT